MIGAMIERDHEAGREYLADMGNATLPAWEERSAAVRAFRRLWDDHRAMLEQAVFPHLLDAANGAALAEALRSRQAEVAGLARSLEERAAGRDADGLWLRDFERLRSLFDAQCEREGSELIPLLTSRTAPPTIAEMTRLAVEQRPNWR